MFAAEQFNWSGVTIEAGGRYQTTVPAGPTWGGGGITCGADGSKTENLPWYRENFVRFLEDNQRDKDEYWFALMATLGDQDKHSQLAGLGTVLAPSETFDLYFYANDLKTRYGNNERVVAVD